MKRIGEILRKDEIAAKRPLRRDWSLSEVENVSLSILRTFPANARFWTTHHFITLDELIKERQERNRKESER